MSEANKPAFPVLDAHLEEGLTKREHYAAKALNGMLAHSTRYKPRIGAPENWHEAISEEAFEIADAMLAETERHNDMLALVERVADYRRDRTGIGFEMIQIIDEARRILGRSE